MEWCSGPGFIGYGMMACNICDRLTLLDKFEPAIKVAEKTASNSFIKHGLDIKDPVSDFFNFCKEREKIRKKREKNEPFPWSDNLIFQNGRFLNVFREDDRVSRSILNFAGRYKDDLPLLVQALFFARWCNKQEVIDSISNLSLIHI